MDESIFTLEDLDAVEGMHEIALTTVKPKQIITLRDFFSR